MIKKEYKQPAMEMVTIRQTQPICASLTGVQSNGLDDADKLDYDNSYRSNLWDDAL
ncbi:MAG: hypothetical protein IJP70_00365 [Bacteroidales bacterium]|nr:hypothetical protein [Bacteroidales bacterium]